MPAPGGVLEAGWLVRPFAGFFEVLRHVVGIVESDYARSGDSYATSNVGRNGLLPLVVDDGDKERKATTKRLPVEFGCRLSTVP